MKNLPTSPQTPWEIIGNSFNLGMSAYFKLFMATSLIAFAEFLPSVDMALRFGDVQITPEIQLHSLGRQLLLLLLAMVVVIVPVQGLVIARLDSLARGEPADYRGEWRAALRAYLPMLGAFVLCMGIGIMGALLGSVIGLLLGGVASLFAGKAGFVLFFCLGLAAVIVYMVIYLLFIQYCIVLEHKGPIDAINRSFRLVYGKWGHAFATMLIIFLIIFVIAILSIIMLGPAVVHTSEAMTGRGLFIKGVMKMVVGALFSPIVLAVVYCLYQDLKLRTPEA